MAPRVLVGHAAAEAVPERARGRRRPRRPADRRRRGRPGRCGRRGRTRAGPGRSSSGLGGGEEVVAEAERDRAGDDREAQVEQGGDRRDRPADQPAGALAARRRAPPRPGAPVRAAMAVPDASASRQPRAPHAHTPAVGLDDHVADVAGVAVGAVEQPAVEHDAAADAGRHDHGEEVAHARARRRASPRRGRAPWRRCRRGRAARARSASRGRSGKPRQAGMLSGDTASPPRRHRPAAPDAAGDLVARADLVDRLERGRRTPPRASPSVGRGRDARGRAGRPSAVDDAGRQLRAADVDGEHTVHGAGTYRLAAASEPVGLGLPCPGRATTSRSTRWPPVRPPSETPSPTSSARSLEQHRAGHPGQARGHRARAALPGLRGPPAHRGRARRRQDQPGQGAGRVDRRHLRPHAVHPRPAAHRRRRRHGVEPQRRASSSSGPARSSPTSCSPTRSTGPRRRRSRRCSRRWPRRQVTVDGTTYPLGRPFMVIATQNPIEHEGTYPLPESQLDRFLMRVSVGYPTTRRRARDPRHPRRPRRARRHRLGDHRPRRAGHGRRRQGGARGARA